MKVGKQSTITLSELMSELDKYRVDRNFKKIDITKDQETFIRKCREPRNKVPHGVMAELWEKLGWGKSSEASIRRRCKIVFPKKEYEYAIF